MKIQEYLTLIDSRAPAQLQEQIKMSGLTLTTYPDIWNPKKGKSTKMFVGLLSKYNIKETEKVLDIGTGCGILALLVWKKGVKNISATDISEESIANAKFNFASVKADIPCKQSNVFSNIRGKFDLILFNAPASHPKRIHSKVGKRALWSDDENILKSFVSSLPKYLHKNGRALVLCSRFVDFDPLPESYLQDMGFSYTYIKTKKGELSTTMIIELRLK